MYVFSNVDLTMQILVFEQADTLNGVANPTKTITLNAPQSTSGFARDIALDARTDSMYLLRSDGSISALDKVSTKAGTVIVDRYIAPSWYAAQIQLDTEHDRLYGSGSPVSPTGVYRIEALSTAKGTVAVSGAPTSDMGSVRAFAVPQ